AMRRTPPDKKDSDKKDSSDASEVDDTPAGAALLLRQLSTGRDASFGNVSEYAWQNVPKTGTLLAMTINAEDKTGNGIQIFDVHTGAVRVLDTSASVYSGLSWRKKSADLAKWEDKIGEPAKPATPAADATKTADASKSNDASAKDTGAAKNKDKDEDEQPAVDVWNWRDVEVMPKQKLNAKNDRQKNMLAAWHLGKNSLVPLGKDL